MGFSFLAFTQVGDFIELSFFAYQLVICSLLDDLAFIHENDSIVTFGELVSMSYG